MIKISNKGDFSRTFKFLRAVEKLDISGVLDKYGQIGVEALSNSSPKDSGLLSESWSYKIVRNDENNIVLEWHNSDIEGGYSVAILVQYGHATKNGTYIQGVDFINPAMKPILESIADDIWKEVQRL